MRPAYRGFLLAAIQLALVASLGGKLIHDRATRPRVWVRTAPRDPDMVIRGRYVSLRLEVPARGFPPPAKNRIWSRAELRLENDQLIAVPSDSSNAENVWLVNRDAAVFARPVEPLAYFIPEHVPDPSVRKAGEMLWVEVTLPKKGPPRPIRLGVMKDGVLTPLSLQ